MQNKYKQGFRESVASSLYCQLPQTAETQLAAKVTDLQSQVGQVGVHLCSFSSSSSLASSSLCVSPVQSKYKEDGMRSLSQSFYSQLPETAETQLARSVSELQSQVTTTHTQLPLHTGSKFARQIICIFFFFFKPLEVSTTFHTGNEFPWSEKADVVVLLFRALVSNFAEAKRPTAGPLTNHLDVGMSMTSHHRDREVYHLLSPANVKPVDRHSKFHWVNSELLEGGVELHPSRMCI